MYNISRLKPRQQDFLTNLAMRNQNRSLVASIALGRVLSAMVPVPTSPVVSVDLFFSQQISGLCYSVLDSINSIVPVDFRLINDLARSFFRHAYDTVHGGVAYAEGRQPSTGIVSFFGIDKHFSQNIIEEIQARHGTIESMVHEFEMVVEALRSQDLGGTNVTQ